MPGHFSAKCPIAVVYELNNCPIVGYLDQTSNHNKYTAVFTLTQISCIWWCQVFSMSFPRLAVAHNMNIIWLIPSCASLRGTFCPPHLVTKMIFTRIDIEVCNILPTLATWDRYFIISYYSLAFTLLKWLDACCLFLKDTMFEDNLLQWENVVFQT